MNSIFRDYSEKRDFIRMKVDATIALILPDNSKAQAICRDLSGTGMSIEAEEEIAEGTELSTSLPSNSDAFPSFDTKVTVVRSEMLENGNYLIGVEIKAVDG